MAGKLGGEGEIERSPHENHRFSAVWEQGEPAGGFPFILARRVIIIEQRADYPACSGQNEIDHAQRLFAGMRTPQQLL